MSRIISTETRSAEVQVISRSWRVEVFTDLALNGDYQIKFYRERVTYLDGVPQGEPVKTVICSRALSQLLSKEVTLADGSKLTGAKLAEAVAKMGDLCELEDEQVQTE